MKKVIENGMYHPCTCTSYNGKQCYNCLNGAHDICSANKKCNRAKQKIKHVGVYLVFKEGGKK